MRVIESRHPGEPWLMWKLGNLTAIDDSYIKSVGIAWLFKENGKWVFMPRITGNDSLFYNAVFFFRITMFPAFWLAVTMLANITGWFWMLWLVLLGIFFGFRWSASTDKKALMQCGIGWKLNGRLDFPFMFRIQSDESAARGTYSPNYGQATGFNYGTH